MVEGAERIHWDIGSILWALIANVNRDPKRTPRAFHPADVHPFIEREVEVKDKDYHRQRRLMMLPPSKRKGVVDKWQSK